MSQPASRPGRSGAVPGHRPAAWVVAALVFAGCAGGGPSGSQPPATGASPAATSAPAASPTATPARSESPPTPTVTATQAATPPASPSPTLELPSEPPAAVLTAGAQPPVEGALGSYTWIDHGSDSPWIVLPAGRAAALPGPYAVTVDPALPMEAWSVAWAPIVDGEPGDVAGSADGGGAPIAFDGPGAGGSWTLKLDVRFAGAGAATYYWRLEAAR